ncbi:berberine bridge enzyme-like Cyn d 4 [Phragmites australis]|uniref:berberine bridge enzyme-like Cyn d 4 n=1 Tax=Phragmites australis TaxID=29695 RepID=UPI002D79C1C9|nr:berberine bridge enzyme-like Cyn d 4 [Phragmites australis]
MARTPRILHLLLALCILSTKSTSSSATSATDAFLGCLSTDIPPRLLHTPATPSYSALLLSSVRNLRYILPGTTRPLAVVAATEPAHVQTTVRCGRRHSIRIRTRSGGHDYEGLSYASLDRNERFAVLDLAELRTIRVDAARAEAWAESGATLGELYYTVGAANHTLAFPAGSCPTVCLGGQLSGGGFGSLARKYGLSADNVLDAVVVDADGRLLNRSTMGEDLFWAIRGGGGESFGVVLSWRLRLVRVPETVTVFSIRRSRNQSAIDLITKWQEIAPVLPWDLYLRVLVQNQHADFVALYLGGCSRLLYLMRDHFPDLGMKQQDCQEISWVQSTVFFAFFTTSKPLELLLDRSGKPNYYLKVKSDHVQEPIPRLVWESTWAWLEKPEAALLMLDPYGGRMGSISPSATPFPHRKGNLYQLQYYSFWFENGTAALEKRMSWVRGLYKEMEPYVSKNPRAVYVNYRDLDLGTNELKGNVTSYAKAKVWGVKYFKGNFERLAAVKSMVDPDDFFRNEQSIPPLPAAKG